MKLSPKEAFLIALAVCAFYKIFTTKEEKQQWEDEIQSHHGEWGVLGAILGAATGHLSLAATGLGLALDDIKDANKWFTGDKANSFDNISF